MTSRSELLDLLVYELDPPERIRFLEEHERLLRKAAVNFVRLRDYDALVDTAVSLGVTCDALEELRRETSLSNDAGAAASVGPGDQGPVSGTTEHHHEGHQ